MACRARGEHYNYSEAPTSQSEGPLQQFLLPDGHSRQRMFTMFRMFDSLASLQLSSQAL